MSSLKDLAARAKQEAQRRRDDVIVSEWAKLYHRRAASTWGDTWWFGARAEKLPADMWIYQEIFFETRPDVVIETGTMNGGSAHFMATMFDLLGQGRVITIDIEDQGGRPEHPRITYVRGSSVDATIHDSVLSSIGPDDRVMVILDSDHSQKHVLDELEVWASAVSPGAYLIVEDGNVNGHPVLPEHGPGPWEALNVWLPRHPEFALDSSREKFMHTFNPRGYLRRSDAG
jgi:cephalosporin hydroxylase